MKPTYDELLEENRELRKLVKQLLKRIADLEAQLKKNSGNSSKPPSSDQKSNIPPKPKKEKRPFHPGASRKLLPDSAVTSRESRSLESCPRCRSKMIPTGEVQKWQQVELPNIKPLVHQIELCQCRCPNCKLVSQPELSEREQYLLGPRLEAFASLCMGQFQMGHRAVREFIGTLILELSMSQGLISKVKARAVAALDYSHSQLQEAILSSHNAIHTDATGWRHSGTNEHVVLLRSGNLISFHIVRHQNSETLKEIFKNRKVNILVTDRGLAISKIDTIVRQYCLAHLLRNIQGLAEHPDTDLSSTDSLGTIFDTIQSLFKDKHRLNRSEIDISTWRQYGYAKWRYIEDILKDLMEGDAPGKVGRFCKRLLKDLPHFKTYLRCRDHPMTNNPAEEGLRRIVIARKLCFGSKSAYGGQWRASIHSCIESLRRDGRSVLDFLSEAIAAYRTGLSCPEMV